MSWGSAPSGKKEFPAADLGAPGVFETLRVYAGRVAALEDHVRRLHASAKTIGLPVPGERRLAQKIQTAVRRSGFRDAIVRLSVHGSAIACVVRAFEGCPASWYDSGVSILTSSVRRAGPRSTAFQVKGNDYSNALGAILAAPKVLETSRREAGAGRAPESDPLLLAEGGAVSETTVANLMMLKAGALWTPPPACGILLGVTRGIVLESAKTSGLTVLETPFTRHDLYNADEVFLTNAVIELVPVVSVDARRIGGGKPGPWSVRLRREYVRRAGGFL